MAGFGSFIPKRKKLGSLTFTFPSIPIHLDAIISKDVYRSTKNREYTSNVIQWNAVGGPFILELFLKIANDML
ncbi:hypothetical protein Tco_0132739 [Tanacetum coccineum]